MKKKSLSLQKLPDLYRQKRDRLVQKNLLFEHNIRPIEKLDAHN